MRTDRNPTDPAKPALIVTYGSCPGKICPLDRDCLVIGRAPACDLVLNSPEVSPVHCLILKTADGWLLRNTNPRVGTQINGQAVQDSRLSDDDCLQIGTFTFKLHLPNSPTDAGAHLGQDGGPKAKRFQASREKVIRLAWRLRRRLLQQMSVAVAEKQAFSQHREELDQRTRSVDARQRECEDLLSILEEEQAEVQTQRQAVLDAAAEFEAFRRETEEEIARHVAEAAAPSQVAWDECRAKEREIEKLTTQLREQARELTAANSPASPLSVRELEKRQAELDAYARHLLRARQNGTPLPDAAVEALLSGLRAESQSLGADQADRAAGPDAAVQRTEVEGLRSELENRAEEVRRTAATLAELQRECDALQQQLQTTVEEQESLRQQHTASRAEKAALREQLAAIQEEREAAKLRLLEQERDLQDKAQLQKESKVLNEELKYLREKLQGARDELKRWQEQEVAWKEQAERLADTDAIRAENEQLHQQVLELSHLLSEKALLQAQLEKHLQELSTLREQLHDKDEELRRFQVSDLPPDAQDQTELTAAVETLLRENEEFRRRLLDQGRALKEKPQLEGRFKALQAEVIELRRQLQARSEEIDFGSISLSDVSDGDETAPVRPNKYLRLENEELKARSEALEAALSGHEQLRERNETLQAQVDALCAQLEAAAAASLRPDSDTGWQELIAPDRTGMAARITVLEDEIRERDTRIGQLQKENAKQQQDPDCHARVPNESELELERQALQAERERLKEELVNVRDDRKELDEAAHTTELQVAKERVQIANEWAELNRKREEFRMELEKAKHDNVRENLDRARRIKEDGKQQHKASLSTMVALRVGDRRKAGPPKVPE